MICHTCGRMYIQDIPARCLCGAALDDAPSETLLRKSLMPQPPNINENTLPVVQEPEEGIPSFQMSQTYLTESSVEAANWSAQVYPLAFGDDATRSTSPYDSLVPPSRPPVPPLPHSYKLRPDGKALGWVCGVVLMTAVLFLGMMGTQRSSTPNVHALTRGSSASPTTTSTPLPPAQTPSNSGFQGETSVSTPVVPAATNPPVTMSTEASKAKGHKDTKSHPTHTPKHKSKHKQKHS